MKEYHKIPTVYERDPETKYKTLIEGKYATKELEYLCHLDWVGTEKIDGTNIRVMWDAETKTVTFGGKTDNSQIPATLVAVLNARFPASLMESVFPEGDVCLYGEGHGAKIQKGGGNYIPDGVDIILFDVKVGEWWLERDAVYDVANKLNLNVVPVLFTGNLQQLVELVRDGFDSQIAKVQGTMAEGLVMRPSVELKDRAGRRIICKIKHKDFTSKNIA